MIKFALLIIITMALWQLMHTWAHVGQLNRTSYAQVHNLWWSHCAKHIHIYVLYTYIIYLSIYVSIYLSVYLSIYLHLSIYLSTYLSIELCVKSTPACMAGFFIYLCKIFLVWLFSINLCSITIETGRAGEERVK